MKSKCCQTEVKDRLSILEQLEKIWNLKGSHPEFHDYQKNRLKKEWPLLYKIIEKILAD